MSDRILDLQERLARLYKLLKGQERAKDEAEAAEQDRIQLKIDRQWGEIRQVEREYARVLSQQVRRQEVPEAEAEILVGELVDEIQVMQPIAKNDEVKALFQQILDELQKPGTPAAAKLKVAIPIIPNLVSYEIEGDTESVVRQLFPTFVKVYEGMRSLGGDKAPGK